MPFRSRFLPKRRIGGGGAARPVGLLSRRRWIGAGTLLVATMAILAGCGTTTQCTTFNNCTPNMLDPKGPIALKEANLFWFILIVATVVFLGVISVLLWSIIKYRARPNSPMPRQVGGNTTLEILWTAAPAAILFAVLAVTLVTMFSLAQPANANPVTVTAVGHQWWWEFDYPDGHFVTADEMHIPVGTVVHIDLRSDNVIHSFWVPQLGGKTDVIPGHDNSMWLKGDTIGTYRGECAEFCGTQHAHMDFVVVVESAQDYANWVANQQAGPVTTQTGLAAQGAQFWKTSQCIGCHQINGVTDNAKAIGPNLTHFGSRSLIAGGVLENSPSNLEQWIAHAQDVKPGSDMPSFAGTYSSQQIDELVAYLESLK